MNCCCALGGQRCTFQTAYDLDDLQANPGTCWTRRSAINWYARTPNNAVAAPQVWGSAACDILCLANGNLANDGV